MTTPEPVPAVSFKTARTGASNKPNEMGMRPMQERAYNKRGEQYLLIKSPPASGKSRALMFIALDKLHNQECKKAIIAVPEKSIGGSFADEPLSKFGFWSDWEVRPQWNLCNAPGPDEDKVDPSKVKAVGQFLESDDRVLVCTHATLRFAVDKYKVEAFDDCLLAIDEFHHVSADADNRLGNHLSEFIKRDKAHIVAMTGSYFRGDAVPVLAPEDEAKFETVTYTYYEQLNGYSHLKSLDIGYYFYAGRYLDAIERCLDPLKKTIVHIPNVNSRESTKDKIKEVEEIIDYLGDWQGIDPVTGFHLVKIADGRTLKIADLVDDSDQAKRAKVLNALKDPAHKNDRDHIDIIIALGMAKEGFDWIWCEHALTVGYRSSLTEIIQIIGRATRDAPEKHVATFTNLIAEPDASEEAVREAINDTLKAIAASLLMEQVLAPIFNFTPKNKGPIDGYNYGPDGYKDGKANVGFDKQTGQIHMEIGGLVEPKSPEAIRVCKDDINEVIAAIIQDREGLEQGVFNKEHPPEEITIQRAGKIIEKKYPDMDEGDREAIRQHAIAAWNVTQKAKEIAMTGASSDDELKANTALIDGVRRFALEVTDLNVDLIDRIDPFEAAYAVIGKSMTEGTLKQFQGIITAKKVKISEQDARDLARRAVQFKKERGRVPDINSQDPWEKRMAEGVAALTRYVAQAKNG